MAVSISVAHFLAAVQELLKEGKFCLSLRTQIMMAVKECEGLVTSFSSQEAESGGHFCSSRLVIFILPRTAPPTFRVVVPTSVNSVLKLLHKQALRFFSSIILDPVK